MTYRQRILAALRGEPVDHIPWAPRWDLWFDAAVANDWLPDKWKNWTMYDIARDIGMGIKEFYAPLYELRPHGVEVVERLEGLDLITEYHTPHGTLRKVFSGTGDLATYGVQGLQTEHPIKTVDDYASAHYVLERTDVVPLHENYDLVAAEVGEDGLALSEIVFGSFHTYLRDWTGYEMGYYHLHDHPNEAERFVEAVTAQRDEILRVQVESSSPVLRLDGNYDSTLTPPPVFDQYFAPEARKWAEAAHRAGKLLFTHTDGEQTLLMPNILKGNFDGAEAFTPPPMTTAGIADARAVWGERMAIWGGIASIMLSAWVPEEQFEAHMVNLFHEAAPGRKFVLGTGDNVPTDADFDRVLRITEMVQEWGQYPIDPARLPPKPEQVELPPRPQ